MLPAAFFAGQEEEPSTGVGREGGWPADTGQQEKRPRSGPPPPAQSLNSQLWAGDYEPGQANETASPSKVGPRAPRFQSAPGAGSGGRSCLFVKRYPDERVNSKRPLPGGIPLLTGGGDSSSQAGKGPRGDFPADRRLPPAAGARAARNPLPLADLYPLMHSISHAGAAPVKRLVTESARRGSVSVSGVGIRPCHAATCRVVGRWPLRCAGAPPFR
jgi:hypothetical protein